jgi:DNA polymerase I-like protein with 3'-5' exonuclease and polymerase domains
MDLITLDFETYYDKTYGLRKFTTEAYIRHPNFEVIGFAAKVNDGVTEWVTGDKEQIARALAKYDWRKSALLAQNTLFDAGILAFAFGIHPKKMLDTMCMGRAALGVDVSVSLANLAKHYGVGEKGTEVADALGKHRLDFTAEELARYGQYCVNDVELTYKIFNLMMGQGFPAAELPLIDLTLRTFTKPALQLDEKLLKKHLQEVKNTKRRHLYNTLEATGRHALAAEALMDGVTSEAVQKSLRSNEQFADLLRTLGVEPPMKKSPTTGKMTWAFAKTDDGFRALQEHADTKVQTVVAARLGVKTTLEETRTQRFIEMGTRGDFPIPLKYYGARTGRWSGMDAVNMQNLPSRGVVTLKQAIRAPDGHVIVGADLSNIELRVGLWLAGQTDKLKQLGGGMDLYKDFASKVFEIPYDDVTKEQRFIGKTSQLSLIYGVGAAKLRQAIKVGSGTDIGEVESKRIVDLYRTQYAHVKSAWDDGEHCLACILQGKVREYGHKSLIKVDGKKGCLLPSGLHLRYPGLEKITEERKIKWVYHTRKGKEYLYGAKFFQGLVQSLARCVMGEQMVRIAKKYHILLTVHDAVYILAKEPDAQNAVDFVLAQMRRAPKWMPDIPLDAEAGYGKTLADC